MPPEAGWAVSPQGRHADVTIQLRTAQLLTRTRCGQTLLHNFETLHLTDVARGGRGQHRRWRREEGRVSAAGDASAWNTPSGPGSPARDSPSGPGSAGRDTPSGPGSPAPAVPVLSLRHAAKSFGAVRAVVDGSADLYAGEAHALLGENGAGKSTVVKMLAGVYQPDEGELLIDGHPIVLSGPAAARDAGIAVIYQEPTLFPDLTVEENIFMGRQPLRAGRRINRRLMREQSSALFERLGVRIDPARICRGLSIADQQLVEIAKALSLDARVIVMDEPTAALSGREVERLFAIVRQLRDRGVAVMFVDHRLEEVFEIADRISVLRDGRLV